MSPSEPQKPDGNSKSQRKKDMLALQKIGESLINLTEEQLAAINLPDNLLNAIHHLKSLNSNEAKRRQLQYIGKIMRQVDPESIKQALKNKELVHKKNTARFHQIEEWRNKLLTQGGEALNSIIAEYPDINRQELQQLISNAEHDKKNNKNTGAEKTLFKYLRSKLGGVVN